MFRTITLADFRDTFRRIERENFSHEGLEVLFDYLENIESDLEEQFEFDPIALCCDYAEASADDIARDYGIKFDDDATDDEKAEIVSEYLSDNGVYVGVTSDGNFVYRQF